MPNARASRRLVTLVTAATLLVLGTGLQGAAAGPPAGAPPAQRTGTLVEAHGDSFGSATVEHGFVLQQANGTMVALDRVPDGVAHGLVGRQVRAWGSERNGRVDVSAGGIVAAAGSTAPAGAAGTAGTAGTAAALAPGVKSVAVVLVNFVDDTRQPWTITQARSVLFDGTTSVNAYYQDASDGVMSISGDVFGYVTITKDNVGCDWSEWGSAARAAAIQAGAPLGNYSYTVYAWPRTSLCGWAGLGYLPGTSSYIDGYLDTRVVGHELGHNFGVHHASTMSCTDNNVATVVTGSCTLDEYGDPFTIMGSSTRLHNNWHRAQLGFDVGTVTIASDATVSLAAVDSGAGTRLVRVPRGGTTNTFLHLEYRQPSGLFDNFASTNAIVSGVTVRIAPDIGVITQSRLIDTSPTIPSSFGDPALKVGQSFTDPLSGVTISVTGATTAAAQVTVSYGADTVAPTAPTGLTATASATLTSASVALRWTASTDDRGVAGYRILRGDELIGTTTSTSYTVGSLLVGTAYTFAVEAFDASGNTSGRATATVTTPVPDTQAPTLSGLFTATVNKARIVSLTWGAGSDDVGVVSYVVSRSGRTMTVSTTSTTDKPGRGTFTYTLVARDAAGNMSSPLSATVIVP